ncbi:MAG: polysaccharide pyruvyl transferase WcaK-like protein [Psychroserpens sp.]
MLIEVKGVQFVNKGAELMLHAIIQQCHQRLPHARLVLEPGVNSPYEKRAAVGALQKFSLRKGRLDLNRLTYLIPKRLRQWLIKSFGIVLEVDLDVILDASGFAYGDQWTAVNTQRLCSEILRTAKQGKKYIILPQALGPFTRNDDIDKLSRAIPKAALVCARDQSSFDNVVGITGSLDNIKQYADFTNLVEPIVDKRWTDYSSLMLIIPNYNMLSERNANANWQKSYVKLMTEAISLGIEQGLTPVILNHEGQKDNQICEMIQQLAEAPVEIFHEADSRRVKGIISVAKLIVCSRFHGCVSALCQGVPCLGTSWSHKYEHLFEEYALSACLLSPEINKAELQQKMLFAIEQSTALSAPSRELYKQQSVDMWDRVVSVF